MNTRLFLPLVAAASVLTNSVSAAESGFVDIFDGKTLNGWKLIGGSGRGYIVEDGKIICPKDGGGNLFTEKEYGNFVLRFDFKLDEGSNNGIGIRAPYQGDAAYMGMEIQVLDDYSDRYKGKIRPEQHHGSVYDTIAAKKEALKPVGQWNSEEIRAEGRHITVTLNGEVITDADLNSVTNPKTIEKHPGMFRDSGHIGFLGHNEYVEFKNLRIKDLDGDKRPDNTPPSGFTALFNGKDLRGWKGLVEDPIKRAKMSPEELKEKQAKADDSMRAHWSVVDGALEFDGKGQSLCTAKDYRNFEMLVDWKILDKGDSGIYLRGSPQVQIWDPNNRGPNPKGQGSGGLYNNKKNPSGPLEMADNPIGQWNTFRIVMVDDKVHVFLNGKLVVNNTTLENYWNYDIPIFPTGQIELQNHGDKLWFKNVYIREIGN
ncbi:MAG TPA: DUF1080 domain-containing protein [Verrucomicrobiae bacterium]